jgi:RNA polymerase sigma factor (sigma-70 family)
VTPAWALALSALPIARAQAGRHACAELPRDDLEQVGMLALHRAALRFDPSRGVRFGTYAFLFVREAMRRAVRLARRGPGNARDEVNVDECQATPDGTDDGLAAVDLLDELTVGERDVAELLIEGWGVVEVADRLAVSRWTVQRRMRGLRSFLDTRRPSSSSAKPPRPRTYPCPPTAPRPPGVRRAHAGPATHGNHGGNGA